jgi:hypothetical protein
MALRKEKSSPPSTIQTMPRTATGQAANARLLRCCASDHWRKGDQDLRGFMPLLF